MSELAKASPFRSFGLRLNLAVTPRGGVLSGALIAAMAHGAPLHVLETGIDLNDTVNPVASVLWDWNGAGADEMVMVDALKGRLVTTITDSPSIWAGDLAETRTTGLTLPAHLLLADIDGNGRADLLLLDGNRFRVWLHKPRSGTGEIPADLEGGLPLAPSDAGVGDFDGDGVPDLLVAAGINVNPSIIFGFATGAADAREFPQLSANAARVYPEGPEGRPVLVCSGGSYSSDMSVKTRIYQVDASRTLVLLDEIPVEGMAADLDGAYPPEIIEPKYYGVSVHAKSGGSWPEVFGFALNYGTFPPLMGLVAGVAEDFDGDGRDEVVFAVPGTDTVYGLQTEGTPSEAVVTILQSAPVLVSSLSSVRAYGSASAHLTLFADSNATDAVGNPVSLAGAGFHGWLRRNPLTPYTSVDYLLGPRRVATRTAVADFNGDLSADLGVLSGNEGQFSVFEGPDWTGSFASRPKLNAGLTGDSFVLGNFTADPLPGLLLPKSRRLSVYSTQSHPQPPPDIRFVLKGERDLGYVNSEAPDRVLGAGDFDQDGDLDSLVFNPLDETLSWMGNPGAGLSLVLHPIALAGRWWQSDVSLWGQYWWQPGSNGYHWITQDQVLVFDADNDSDPDIITLPSALGNRLTLHRNHGGTFSLETLLDFDTWRQNDPFGQYSVPDHLLAGHFMNGSSPVQFAMAGFRADALGSPGSFIAIVQGPVGSITVQPPQMLPLFGAVTVCDFDADGFDDLITTGRPSVDGLWNLLGSDLAIRFHRSLGNGSFGAPVIIGYSIGQPSQLTAADLTGDGLPDIVASSRETGTIEFFRHASIPAYPGYAEWIAGFSVNDAATSADSDADGASNLLEFARGTPPDSADPASAMIPPPPVSPMIDLSGPYEVRAVHPRPRLGGQGNLLVSLEESTDMQTWTPAGGEPSVSFDPVHPQWDSLQWYAHKSGEVRFFRFKVVHVAED